MRSQPPLISSKSSKTGGIRWGVVRLLSSRSYKWPFCRECNCCFKNISKMFTIPDSKVYSKKYSCNKAVSFATIPYCDGAALSLTVGGADMRLPTASLALSGTYTHTPKFINDLFPFRIHTTYMSRHPAIISPP